MTASPLGGLRERLWAMSRPQRDVLYYANGGIGDELMLTAVAHAAREQGQPFHVLTNLSELWRENTDALSIATDVDRWHYARRRAWLKSDIRHLAYETTHRGRHIAQQMADHVGVVLPTQWRPHLPAIRSVRRHPRRIVVQNSCRGARFACDTKEWRPERWQEVVNALPDWEFIQLGTERDPPLQQVVDLRGRTSLLGAAEMLASAVLFLGLESGLMHAAAAVSTPAVIVYGGRTAPTQTGYPFHVNLCRRPACVECGLDRDCPHAMMCMDIPTGEVLAAVRQSLAAR